MLFATREWQTQHRGCISLLQNDNKQLHLWHCAVVVYSVIIFLDLTVHQHRFVYISTDWVKIKEGLLQTCLEGKDCYCMHLAYAESVVHTIIIMFAGWARIIWKEGCSWQASSD